MTGGTGDSYANRMMKALTFDPIIDTLVESAARNSLLNSAVLEMFAFMLKAG